MILITGHKGFVGSHLTKLLDEMKIEWIGYDLVEGNDIRNRLQLENYFLDNRIDAVIHLAALVHPIKSMMFPDEYISTNVNGTHYLLDCAKRHNVKHFVFFSSSSIYGNQQPPNSEDSPYMSESIYAMSKASGEMLVRASGVPYTIIRPFTIYGENGRKDQVIYKWLNMHKDGRPITVFGNGSSKRGYTYVKDLIEGILTILAKPKISVNQTFNLGGTEIISINDLAEIFKDSLGAKIEYLPLPKGDVYENWADITKAQKMLGYNPKENFRKNVLEIISKF